MKHKRYEKIGEDLYFGQLRNGLNVNVVTKPGFRLSYAVFATNYGGAHQALLPRRKDARHACRSCALS